MDNLRWILIVAGIAILALLYFSGRQSRTANRQRRGLERGGDRSTDRAQSGKRAGESRGNVGEFDSGFDNAANPGAQDPLLYNDDLDPGTPAENFANALDNDPMDDPLERPGGVDRGKRAPAAASGFVSMSSKIEAIGNRLKSKRASRVAASRPRDNGEREAPNYASKIVTLHIVAPEGELFNGAQLLGLFEQRGYHYGEMNIFHSMHQGKTVFSIAKLVVPGTFDIDDVDSFQTPGISLILQLPGPVPADVAFDVLLSEAGELAVALGANVLDADRSTLSKQTVQHMREGIYEYMHRQKYFTGEPA